MDSTATEMIEIVLNGEPRRVPPGLSVEQLLRFLDVDVSRVAVERNRTIVRKPLWSQTPVRAGDQFEIVWFVGGG